MQLFSTIRSFDRFIRFIEMGKFLERNVLNSTGKEAKQTEKTSQILYHDHKNYDLERHMKPISIVYLA